MTSRVSDLRKIIRNVLLTVHQRVYYEAADPRAALPYIVFDLPASADMEAREDFQLEVDVWAEGPDTTALETLADYVDRALDGLRHLDNSLLVRIHRTARAAIRDPEDRLKRRHLRYEAKTYFLGV